MALTTVFLCCLSVPLFTAQSVPPLFAGVFPPLNCSGENCLSPLPPGFNESAFQLPPGVNDLGFQFPPFFNNSAFQFPPGFNDSAFQLPAGFNNSGFPFPFGFNESAFPFPADFNISFPKFEKSPPCTNSDCLASSNLLNVSDPKIFNGTFPFPFPNFGGEAFNVPPGPMGSFSPPRGFGRFPLPPMASGR